MPTLCLNMIVKNESKIIERLLGSVAGIIDTYCICDTGSTDNTIELINQFFGDKKIEGKVVQEPFQNFEYNRNFALQQCEGMSDYVLFLDADMIFEVREFDKDILGKYDSFHILQGNDSFFFNNMRIVRNNGQFKYIGVTHEYISTPDRNSNYCFKKNELFISDIGDGGSKHDKFIRDINLLTEAIRIKPNCDRSHFYLGNSYHDSGQFEKAIPIYEQRIKLGGWAQEVWYSYYRIGLCYKQMGQIEKAICAWMEGFSYLPSRVENLYEIVKHYRETSKHTLSHNFYKMAKEAIAKDEDRTGFLFLHNDIYTHKLDYEYTIIASYLNVNNINDQLVHIFNISNEGQMLDNILSNLKFYKDVLKATHTLKFDDMINDTINGQKVELRSTSSCIVENNSSTGSKYCLNIRYVNYYISENGGYLNCDDSIITKNRYVELDDDFTISNSKWFDHTDDTRRRYVGIEDVRIYKDKHTDNMLFIGTGFLKDDRIGIVNGIYDLTNNTLDTTEITSSFNKNFCEKNWVYVEYKEKTHIVYNWSPVQLCETREDNQIYIVSEKLMPNIFKRVRGSTCGYKHNNEIWFVTHIVSYEQPRHYYHMMVVFDNDMNLLRYSAPFKFDHDPIEYCLGLIVKDNNILVSYSTWDRTTRVGIYNKEYIETKLKYRPNTKQ
jgi:tetratricopeptide (TPR) repeat protein